MKKVTILTASSILTLCVGYGSAFSNDIGKSPVKRSVPRKSMSFLLTIASKKGKIRHVKDNVYFLDFKLNDITQVNQIPTDLNKSIHLISDSSLEKVWALGDNNFAKHPARAVLSGNHLTQTGIVLQNMQVSHNDIIYQFTSEQVLHDGDYQQVNLVINKHAVNHSTNYGLNHTANCTDIPVINGQQPTFVVAHYELV